MPAPAVNAYFWQTTSSSSSHTVSRLLLLVNAMSDFLPSFLSESGLTGAMVAVLATIALVHFMEGEERDRSQQQRHLEPERITQAIVDAICNRRYPFDENQPNPKRRVRIQWDHNRARMCVHADYMGPTPLFNDRQFERTFRVTRQVADKIHQVASDMDPFFRDGVDAAGKPSISSQVKLLMGLKILAYGVSPSAFIDYFQMGESTGQLCFKRLTHVVSHSTVLKEMFRRPMTRDDAKNVVALHEEHHGISGMIGSLDCMHVGWRTCPVAWQGQYKGKEDSPTIVLEAYADYNLWIWHMAFGFAGTLNNINIWDQSPLLKSFLDGSFHRDVDFEYTIAGRQFRHLFLLVDGIYPELSRFVKTLDEAVGDGNKRFAMWQESSRKDIERTFGVLQRKFHILSKPVELWYVNEIRDMVECCVTLHNMMVSVRIERNEQEETNWYELTDNEVAGFNAARAGVGDGGVASTNDPNEDYVARLHAENELQHRLELA